MSNPFRYFNSSPEVIRLVVMMYVRYPLSLRNVEDLLAERLQDLAFMVDRAPEVAEFAVDLHEDFATEGSRAYAPLASCEMRREKAALSSGCKPHPATAPAGSNRSSHGGDEMAEAFGVAGHI